MNRHVIVPAKKRVNPWTVARVTGLSALGLLGTCALIVWPWVHAFTTNWGPFTFLNLAAFLLLAAQGLLAFIVVFTFFSSGFAGDLWDEFTTWWSERESKYGQVDDR